MYRYVQTKIPSGGTNGVHITANHLGQPYTHSSSQPHLDFLPVPPNPFEGKASVPFRLVAFSAFLPLLRSTGSCRRLLLAEWVAGCGETWQCVRHCRSGVSLVDFRLCRSIWYIRAITCAKGGGRSLLPRYGFFFRFVGPDRTGGLCCSGKSQQVWW